MAHLGSRTGRDHERSNPEDERKGRHQDRTKPCARRTHRGFAWTYPLQFRLPREFDDQDRVLGGQTHENDEADLSQNVDRHPAPQEASHRSEQAHRHDQHHRERQFPVLVLCSEHQEHEQRGRAEHQ